MVQSLFGHSRVSVMYLSAILGSIYYVMHRFFIDNAQVAWSFAHYSWQPPHWLDITLGTLLFITWPVIFNQALIYNLKLYKSTGYPTLMGLLSGIVLLVFGSSVIDLLLLLIFFYSYLRIITQWNQDNQINRSFAIGLLSGGAFLAFPPAFILLVVLLLSLPIYGRIDLRLFLLSIFGAIMPVYIIGSIAFLLDDYSAFHTWFASALLPADSYLFSVPMAIAAAVSVGWVLLSLKDFFTAVSRAKIIKRNALTLALAMLIMVIASGAYFGKFAVFFMAVLPLSLLSANFMQYLRKRFWLNLWVGLTIMAVIAQWVFR